MSVRLILVCDCETDWDTANKLKGRADIFLNENGIEQINGLAAKFKKSNEKPEIIISSPVPRALQSASMFSDILGISLRVDKNLAERDSGNLTGQTWERINKFFGFDLEKGDRKQKYDYSSYGGESAEEVNKRRSDFINYAREEFKGKTIIVVTHPGILNSHSKIEPGEYCIIEL